MPLKSAFVAFLLNSNNHFIYIFFFSFLCTFNVLSFPYFYHMLEFFSSAYAWMALRNLHVYPFTKRVFLNVSQVFFLLPLFEISHNGVVPSDEQLPFSLWWEPRQAISQAPASLSILRSVGHIWQLERMIVSLGTPVSPSSCFKYLFIFSTYNPPQSQKTQDNMQHQTKGGKSIIIC